MTLKDIGKWSFIASLAWIEEDGPDRLLVGGVLLCMLALHIVVLNEVFTGHQVDVEPLQTALQLLTLLIGWYILQPITVYQRARDETAQKVEERVES